MRNDDDDFEEDVRHETVNDESPQRIPYIGELFSSVESFADTLARLLFGESEPTIWEVTRLDWYEEGTDDETGEWLEQELIISFVDVLDPSNDIALSFVDLDLEMEKFVF